MSIPIYQVDAFTDRLFAGNPAAVVVLEQQAETEWMQSVAREMNLSETAFVHPQQGGYHLQWFTPQVEVDLCGHATLATAHILWQTSLVNTIDSIRFFTRSGWLTASQRSDLIEMDFPSAPVVPMDVSEEIITAVGGRPDNSYMSRDKWLFEYANESIIRNLKPDFAALKQRTGRALAVTAPSSTPAFDFVSRYFAPWIGIDEDPVTGSAHCILGPYWAQKLGKNHMTAFQASERGGIVYVRISGDRTYVGGKAVTVFSGKLGS
ncbi:MAG: oxidoreductase [Chloroflexi bacterium HGW-Chloroflexi-4]|jgi:predicted PhzF superfamily epimerase YddE/YHI9|nr:MAG: oxidoreductase [Chloroflexi bacterium HGW-Chloroflexi-7]PKN99775.1 MAG: oxidoreductase [Chloroflexi bacterium HGW-Chloroflexi-4]